MYMYIYIYSNIYIYILHLELYQLYQVSVCVHSSTTSGPTSGAVGAALEVTS